MASWFEGTGRDEITLEMPQADGQEAAPRWGTVRRQAGQSDLTRVPIEVAVVIAQGRTKTEAPAPAARRSPPWHLRPRRPGASQDSHPPPQDARR
jgi:hypothetical protein